MEKFDEKNIVTQNLTTTCFVTKGNGRWKCRRWRVWEDRIGRLEGSAGINATRRAICYRNSHLRRLDTDMDDLRDSFSSLKKCIKRRIKGKKGKADNPGAGRSGETVGPSGPPPRPGPAVTTGGGREQEGDEPNAGDESLVEPSAAPDENKPDWKSGSAKMLLREVRDSADAFGPLKAVAGGLCFILENCEVCFLSTNVVRNAHLFLSVRRQTSKR